MPRREFHGPRGELPPGIQRRLLQYCRGEHGRLWYRCYWSIGSDLLSAPEAPVAESAGALVLCVVSTFDAAAAGASEKGPIESVALLSRGLGALDENAAPWPGLLGTIVVDFHHLNVFVKKNITKLRASLFNKEILI
jgi:hypothetical protein